MSIGEHLNNISSGIATSFDQNEMVSFNIWAAAITTTRAFEKVEIKINDETSRVFVAIHLRWWAKFKGKRLDLIRTLWLKRAVKNVKEHIPTGWSHLIYYENKKDD